MTVLASGSLGNAVLVTGGRTRLLVDAGLPADELEQRLVAQGIRPGDVTALFLTHRHKDHVRGATDFARRHRSRILCTRRTARSLGSEVQRRIRRIEPLAPFATDDLVLRGVPLVHDAPETVGLLVEHGPWRYGHATDLGCTDGPIAELLTCCHVLLLEFNHDRTLLCAGSDPPHLKRRILARTGHLANDDAARLLSRLAHPRLEYVVCAHVSRRNNRPDLVRSAAARALAHWPRTRVGVATQDVPLTVEVDGAPAAPVRV